MGDSIDSGNFSVRGYLPLIRKDSITHMLGLAVYVKEDFLLHAIYLQKTLRILTYVFDFDSYFTQCLTSFSSIDHLFRRYARFLTLFTVFLSNTDKVLSINPSANVYLWEL